MIFTEQEVDIILNNPKNLVNQFERDNNCNLIIKEKVYNDTNVGQKRLTTEERVLIGTMARAGLGSTKDIAKEFDIDADTVSNYKAGRTTFTSHPDFKPNPELEEKILGKLDIVQERAIELLLNSIGVITPEKLAKLNAKDASVVASNASKIVQNCAPQVMNDNRIQVVMYAPKQKELKDYEEVEV